MASPAKVVMVVEDDDLVRDVIEATLDHAGYHVLAFARGSEALQALASSPVDALLTDIMMPELDGFELSDKARAIRPDLPIIFMTGYHDIELEGRPSRAFLRKPFRPDELTSTMRKVIPAAPREPLRLAPEPSAPQ